MNRENNYTHLLNIDSFMAEMINKCKGIFI